MWQIYDQLIDGIPKDLYVEDCVGAMSWTLVKSKNTGIAMTYTENHKETELFGNMKRMPLKDLAKYIKSWNFNEAMFALAAINSYYNTEEKVISLKGTFSNNSKDDDAFIAYKEQLRGKNVAVIGHFPHLDPIDSICKLSILERNPLFVGLYGDLPDTACEYILGDQDFVFITGTTIANKTLPRLLQLSKNAKVILVGPSVSLAPSLFEHGVDVLASTIVINEEKCWQIVKEGGCLSLFDNGTKMARIEK